jgi:predicted amidohydrolase YtcJ
MAAELAVLNGRITTLDDATPSASAFAISDGRFVAIGGEAVVRPHIAPDTKVIDLGGRTVVPGLNDSHLHLIRGGLNYNMELRWDGVPSLADAMRMLREQVARTPAPQWVRVVGGWTEFQFAERRMPTLDEINAAAPDTPVFVLNLYRQAFLNRAALYAAGYDKNSPNPPGGEIQRDTQGNPTGLLIARPNAGILYATLAKGPKLSYEDQLNSSRLFMREMNRYGLTSFIDPGGGFQNFPDDYKAFDELARRGELTVRTAYNLFTQHPGSELADFKAWIAMTKPYSGTEFYRHNGAGEMLTFSAADFEDFPEARPDLPASMETDLYGVVHALASNGWPFRIHATYDESISRFLDIFERVDREVPLSRVRWFFDHAETVTQKNLERTAALGGGIAVQDRMAFQGEYFVDRYGAEAARHSPPIKKMLAAGVPVGAGTDATRVSSYNPWVALYWLVSGKTVGGLELYPEENRFDRAAALRLYTRGSAWFSKEEAEKGAIATGMLGDAAVLTDDYFAVAEEKIKSLESVLTIVGGKVVYGTAEFAELAPPAPPASPSWSPHNFYAPYPANGSSPAGGGGRGHLYAPHSHAFDLDCFAF